MGKDWIESPQSTFPCRVPIVEWNNLQHGGVSPLEPAMSATAATCLSDEAVSNAAL
jgi:hypothetical protein